MRQGGADRSDVAHHVQLPVRVPLLVSDVLEPGLPGDAGVVDEHLEAAEGRTVSETARSGSPELEVACHVERLADAGCLSPAQRNASSLLDELFGHGAADTARRAGDEARPSCKSQIHGELAYRP